MHYLNDKGPCKTTGSIEGDDVKSLLDKYYTYNYTNLKVYEFQYDFTVNGLELDDTEELANEILNHLLT